MRLRAFRESRSNRIKTPTVLQMEAVECGAAALAIILGSFGKIISLEELRVACGVSRDGSKASNILKAARGFGLEAKGFRKEPESLREGPFPVIVHWNFNHFLVLEGFKKGRVYLNDPAVGPRTVSEEEFDESFTGIVLTFTPGPDFRADGAKRSLRAALRRRLHGSESALTFAVLAGLLLVVPGLVIPVFTKVFVDQILMTNMASWLMPLLFGMGLTALLRSVLGWLQLYYLQRMESKIAIKTSGEFFWHVLRLPIEFFTQRQAGEIADRVMLNDAVASLLSRELASTMLSMLMIVFYLFLMLQYNVMLTVVGVMIALLSMAFVRYTSRWRVDQNMRMLKEAGKLAGTSMSGLKLIETLKAGGDESDFFAKWAGYQAQIINSTQRFGLGLQLLGQVPTLLGAVNTVLILAIGGLQVINGNMTVGMLVAFQSLMASFLGPVNQLVTMSGALQAAEANMSRLDDVLRHPVAVNRTQSISPAPADHNHVAKLNGKVELRNVSFGYSRLEPPLIENFSLKLEPGARVALVGGSGSGKSTIAKLLSGLYEPWSGDILFDDRPKQEIPPALLSNSLTVIDQDICMFEGTLRDNLTLWDTTISEIDLIRASKDAAIHEDISTRGGYESELLEDGHNYSGGQRQRMEIARALAKNPTILIMDEATSALDTKTEQHVDHCIRRRGCTCVIVAHRLSTIRDCDEIIVLDHGKVAQRGTHEELVSMAGRYRDLISA